MSITRRQFFLVTSASVAAAAWPIRAAGRQAPGGMAQQPGASPQPLPAPLVTAFTALRNDTGFFTGQGGTIGWLISTDAIVVVDTQMAAAATACLAGVRDRAGSRMIDVVFNTHHHYDHTDGNSVFRPAARKILAQVNVPALQKKTARPGTEATQVYADSTFADRWSQSIGKERLTAVYYGPAHTGGDSVVTFERANVVHIGDLVFNRRMPVTDRPGGCQIAGWITVLERVVKDHPADAVYIFGHAKPGLPPTGAKADVLLQRDFLTALLEHVRGEVKAGKPREEIVKASPELKGFPEHGALTERVLTAAYEELTIGSA
jgi:cyclase